MESVLKEKQRRGQNTSRGAKQYHRFQEVYQSHSSEAQEVLRSYNLTDCDFGKRATTTINSRNFIGAIWLLVTLADGDSGENYCEHVGLRVLDQLTYRFGGRKFHDFDYESVAFAVLHKIKDQEKLKEILRLAGGAAKINPGQVVVPLFNFFSPYNRELEHGPCWANGGGASRLEMELQFSPKAALGSGHTSHAISNVSVYYQEVLVPVSVENAYKSRQRQRPRIEYNQIKTIAVSSGVEKECDVSALLSGGNIRQFIFRERVGTGATQEPLNTGRPTKIEIRINDVSLFEESEPILSQWMLLQGYDYDENETQPICVPFCQRPQDSDSSGYLPSSNDKMTIHYTAGTTCNLDIICEYEKVFKRVNNGRIEKSDS